MPLISFPKERYVSKLQRRKGADETEIQISEEETM